MGCTTKDSKAESFLKTSPPSQRLDVPVAPPLSGGQGDVTSLISLFFLDVWPNEVPLGRVWLFPVTSLPRFHRMFPYIFPTCSELVFSSTQSRATPLTFLTKYPSLMRIGSRSMAWAVLLLALSAACWVPLAAEAVGWCFHSTAVSFHKFLSMLIASPFPLTEWEIGKCRSTCAFIYSLSLTAQTTGWQNPPSYQTQPASMTESWQVK